MSLLARWPNISKICLSTAINSSRYAVHDHVHINLPGSFGASGKVVLLIFALIPLLCACTPVRPIVKIGLIAPFEGLYRESGYAALAAMRQALDECVPPGLDVIPLALDDSGDPAQAKRAAQKLLVDPSVRAIVGPLLLDTLPAVTEVMMQKTDLPWLIPALVAPVGGFATPQANAWLESQVDYIATTTPAARVLLLGLPAAWPLQVSATVPVLRIDDLDSALATAEASDAILWLGRPEAGARWLSALRLQQPTVPFWLADQAGIDIFVAHATDLHATYSLYWRDVNYNQWSQSAGSRSAAPATQPAGSMDYLTYRATCVALSSLATSPTATPVAWQLQSRAIERIDSKRPE